MSWHDRYNIAKNASDKEATADVDAQEKSDVSKQLPASAGPDVIDQFGWTTQYVDTPPNLPASTSLYFDTEETVNKAREVVADLKTLLGGK